MPRISLSFILITITGSSLTGQATSLVPQGSQVRLWAPDLGHHKAKATVRRWYDSTVAFTLSNDQQDTLIPFADLTKLEVLAGEDRWRGAGMGAALGGLAGVLVGGLVGNSAVQGCEGFLCELDALNYAAAGMLIGIAVGTPIGIGAAPNKWERVDLPTDLGFPKYHTPWYKTTAFNIASGVAATLLLIAISGGS